MDKLNAAGQRICTALMRPANSKVAAATCSPQLQLNH
jgi:hypothetical protein